MSSLLSFSPALKRRMPAAPSISGRRQAYHTGYTSIMIDGSKLPFEDNIALTRRVTDACHPRYPRRGELGRVGGKEDDLENADVNPYTDPEEARTLWKRLMLTFWQWESEPATASQGRTQGQCGASLRNPRTRRYTPRSARHQRRSGRTGARLREPRHLQSQLRDGSAHRLHKRRQGLYAGKPRMPSIRKNTPPEVWKK